MNRTLVYLNNIFISFVFFSLLNLNQSNAAQITSVRCFAKFGDYGDIAYNGDDLINRAHLLGYKRKFGLNKSFGNRIELTPAWRLIRFRKSRSKINDPNNHIEGSCDIKFRGSPKNPVYIE